ncbi:MAG TPA: acetate uptake transporter [Ktedonobacteraceae bacterium]|nr:acetate uptake transporter [Ktedonobacteraceae bacterium]
MAQIAAERAEAAAPAKANPAPLGLAAFGLTTFIAMSGAAGWYTGAAGLVGLAFFYGGLGQLIAGFFEFRNGNTFAGAAFSSYGGFWLAYGWALQNNQLTSSTGVGFYMLAWAFFTFLWFLGTLRVNVALMAVFLFLTLTFLGLSISSFGGGDTWLHISGYVGVITAILAWYTAAAGMLASTNSPVQLPVFPLS